MHVVAGKIILIKRKISREINKIFAHLNIKISKDLKCPLKIIPLNKYLPPVKLILQVLQSHVRNFMKSSLLIFCPDWGFELGREKNVRLI